MVHNQSFFLKLAFVIFIAQLALYSSRAFAWCAIRPTVVEEFRSSTVVLVGKVVAEEKVSVSDDYLDGINYQLKVSEILRGMQVRGITLFSENSSGRFPMRVGESYLIFASLEQSMVAGHSVWTVNNCGNSGLLSSTQYKLREVRRLVKK